jgi:aspartyl-tRNA(Asn)/glutamyl-tRNA(Gln) amidotransferase subunit B
MTYETVIGLEVHVELNTKSKMFCGCSAEYFGKEPNTHTCPVCLGLPGALPYINEEAIDKCMQIGMALGCSVNRESRFERKNYFYPDLSKGFQISQLRWPLNVNGSIEVEDKSGKKQLIRINRVHQEEDTGKLMHRGDSTVVDFNRSGVPLVEIVTEPDFRDSESVRNYAKALQQIFRDLGVSNADMERGDMRLEANISVRPEGQAELANYRVELKNINSFRFMVAAIEYEVKRQIKALENGETLKQETRGWNESKQETFLQRSKEEANDYRYFPEPDLPEMEIDEERIRSLKDNLPLLSSVLIDRLVESEGLARHAVLATLERLNEKGWTIEGVRSQNPEISVKQVVNLVANLGSLDQFESETAIADEIGARANKLDDTEAINGWVDEVIVENPTGAVDSYKSGKEAAMGVLVGMVMRKSGGRVDAGKVREILISKLSS